jgi:hypothetical protein
MSLGFPSSPNSFAFRPQFACLTRFGWVTIRRRYIASLFGIKSIRVRDVKYWEIIADNLSKAGWSLGWVSAVDARGEQSGLLTRIAATESTSCARQ